MELKPGTIFEASDEDVGGSVISDIYTQEESDYLKKMHVIGDIVDVFIGRDAGDNLVVKKDGVYMFWDHETEILSILGEELSDFVTGYEE